MLVILMKDCSGTEVRNWCYMVWFSQDVIFLPMLASLLQVIMTDTYFNLS